MLDDEAAPTAGGDRVRVPVLRVLAHVTRPGWAATVERAVAELPGAAWCGTARGTADLLARCGAVDVVVLDAAPETGTGRGAEGIADYGRGLGLAATLRHNGFAGDIVAVVSARAGGLLAQGLRWGVVQFLVEPVSPRAVRDKIEGYARFRAAAARPAALTGQNRLDRAVAALCGPAPAQAPKGLSTETLHRVVVTLRATPGAWDARALGDRLGLSRVTARRYLEHLARAGRLERVPAYGSTGRPRMTYRTPEAGRREGRPFAG